jgi:signal transduction histidine kinase
LIQQFDFKQEQQSQIICVFYGNIQPIKERPILDQNLLEKILSNLLYNAIKYSDKN